jgi:pantoate kinase
MARKACHADESCQYLTGEFFIQVAIENERGYTPFGRFPTLETAVAAAREFNQNAGLTEDDVRRIRLSSMTWSNQR